MKIKVKLKSYIFILLLIITIFSCRKDKANWSSNWVVPLVNDSLIITDYVNDSTLAINSDNTIQVVLKRSLVDLNLSDLVKIPDTTIQFIYNIKFPVLQVPPGFTFINDTQENNFDMGDAVLLEARIKSGKAKIHVENPVATKAFFNIALPGVHKNGIEYNKKDSISGGTPSNPGVRDVEIDFSGYTINMQGKSGTDYNILQSEFSVTSDENGEEIIITEKDKFNILISFENLIFDYGKGYLGNRFFSDTTKVDLPLFNKIVGGAINIDDLNLNLILRNGIVAAAIGNINLIKSINKKGEIVELNHPYFNQSLTINPANGNWENLTASNLNFSFNNTTGNLKEFIENLGDKYELGYNIELNPYGNISYGNNIIYPKSKIGIDLEADFPLKIGANGLIIQDTFAIDFKNDNKLLQVKSGKLTLNTENTFPYGAIPKLFLLDADSNFVKELLSVGEVSPAVSDVANQKHIPVENTVEFIVDEETASVLPDIRFIVVRAEFNSTQFQNNVVYANASLKFTLLSQLKLKVSL